MVTYVCLNVKSLKIVYDFRTKYTIQLKITSTMVKNSHVSRLVVFCKNNLMLVCRGWLKIYQLLYNSHKKVLKKNTLININCLALGFASQAASTITTGCVIMTTL